ncbi:MAG: hypothetical protein QXT84_03725, partial [Candidatus Bathyarchaeia archaeon]
MSEDIIERAKQKLEEYERRKHEIAQTIDLKELIRKTRELKSIFIEGVGEIRYGSLTFADLVELSKYQSNEERTIAV